MTIGTSDGQTFDDHFDYMISRLTPPPSDPLDYTNKFNTPLTDEQQNSFNSKFSRKDIYDYDMQGWFKNNPNADPNAPGTHYPDTFKKPNHPTFSDESIYHGDQYQGGTWMQNEDKSDAFVPGKTNLELHGMPGLKDYFNKTEPNVELVPPSTFNDRFSTPSKFDDRFPKSDWTIPPTMPPTGTQKPTGALEANPGSTPTAPDIKGEFKAVQGMEEHMHAESDPLLASNLGSIPVRDASEGKPVYSQTPVKGPQIASSSDVLDLIHNARVKFVGDPKSFGEAVMSALDGMPAGPYGAIFGGPGLRIPRTAVLNDLVKFRSESMSNAAKGITTPPVPEKSGYNAPTPKQLQERAEGIKAPAPAPPTKVLDDPTVYSHRPIGPDGLRPLSLNAENLMNEWTDMSAKHARAIADTQAAKMKLTEVKYDAMHNLVTGSSKDLDWMKMINEGKVDVAKINSFKEIIPEVDKLFPNDRSKTFGEKLAQIRKIIDNPEIIKNSLMHIRDFENDPSLQKIVEHFKKYPD